jgi:hypothetical protein
MNKKYENPVSNTDDKPDDNPCDTTQMTTTNGIWVVIRDEILRLARRFRKPMFRCRLSMRNRGWIVLRKVEKIFPT